MKKIILSLIILISLFSILSVDLNNITFSNEEFYNGAITNSKILNLSNGKVAVAYQIGTNVNYLKICESTNLTDCNSAYTAAVVGGSTINDFDIIEDITNNRIIYTHAVSNNLYFTIHYLTGSASDSWNVIQSGQNTDHISTVRINNTHYALSYTDVSDGSRTKLIICEMDGSPICLSETTLSGTTNPQNFKIILGSDGILKVFQTQNNNGEVRSFDTSLNFISQKTIHSGIISFGDMLEGSDNNLKFVFRDNSNSNYGTFRSCDLNAENCLSEIVYYNSRADYNNINEFNEQLFIAFNDGSTGALNSVNFNLIGEDLSSVSLFDSFTGEYVNQIITTENQLIISYGANSKGKFAISDSLSSSTIAGITFNNPVIDSYINTTAFNLNISFSEITNSTYSLNEGLETILGTSTNESNINLIGVEGLNSIQIFTNTSNSLSNATINFTIDTIFPNINLINTSKRESYSNNWNSIFNYSDENFDSCWLIVENTTENCDSYTFTNNGNQSVQIYVNDSAGNTITQSFVVLIDPKIYIYFEEPSTTTISNFNFNEINYENYAEINVYDLGIGIHNLTFLKYGYAQTNISLELTLTSQINTTETILVSLLYINIKDRKTNNLITQTIDFDLVGESYSSSYSTNTGQSTITEIKELPGIYRLSFASSGYANNEYYFQHTGYTAVNITTYLINESLTIPVKIIVRDIFSNAIKWTNNDGEDQGCIVKVKQYFILNNDYLAVDMGITNSLGEIIFDLEYNKFYQFVIDCDGIIKTEPGQKITSTPLYLTFNPNEKLTIFDELPNLAGDIIFDNLTNTTGYFRFEYNDLNNIASKGCLYVYEQKFSGDILIDSSCVNSASATINVNLNFTTNKKYIGKGFVTYNGEEHFIDSKIKKFLPGQNAWSKGMGLWSSVLIIGVLFLIGIGMHPFAGIIFAWLGALIMNLFGALALPEGSLMGLLALLIGILIFRGDKL